MSGYNKYWFWSLSCSERKRILIRDAMQEGASTKDIELISIAVDNSIKEDEDDPLNEDVIL